ncbi:D-hexose-6-phosphate mutarotase [Paraglaciecola sp. 2405UD69-4]|uniref:D-hexose-6-phosphate mutarotase n=1 Tax=Paraglaciecola sp. 2405UD69-4 TaxID=3391836 RepID=UPI0039C9B141
MQLPDSISLSTRDNVQILKIDNAFATAEVSLFGGHILSYVPKHDNKDRLWVSKNALFDGKKAIRGGVPICWPWFGDHQTNSSVASHGYVRTQKWAVTKASDTTKGTLICLQPETTIGTGFDGQASLQLSIEVSSTIVIKLETTNVGDTPFDYSCALHTYFNIKDIHQCQLQGLTGNYKDKTRNFDLFETTNPYVFTEETDRVHLQQPKTLTISDSEMQTQIGSSGHDSIVVWNPWKEKSISMGDMADESYLTMLCVETAITQGHTIEAGKTHVLEQIIK